jgi:CIC family chloride channel protein
LLVASVSAILTSYFFFGSDIILQSQATTEFQIQDIFYYILLGVVCAVFSLLFMNIYRKTFKLFERITSKFNRVLLGGVSLGVLIFLFPQLYGEGYPFMNQILSGDFQFWETSVLNIGLDGIWPLFGFFIVLIFFKIIATSITISSGGVGGIFAPVLFIGCIIGTCFSFVIKQSNFISESFPYNNFALVGMAGLMSGVMHAPLTAIFLIAEITSGYHLFIPLMVCTAIAYGISHRFQKHSIYNIELAQRGQLVTHDKDETVLGLLKINKLIEKNFVVLHINMTLGEIVEKGVMKSSRNLFPITDENRQFKGILLLDDIRGVMFKHEMYDSVFVSELMQTAPDIIDLQNCNAKMVMQKFKSTEAWNLPVVRNGKYVGFISKSKLLTAYRDKLVDLRLN